MKQCFGFVLVMIIGLGYLYFTECFIEGFAVFREGIELSALLSVTHRALGD